MAEVGIGADGEVHLIPVVVGLLVALVTAVGLGLWTTMVQPDTVRALFRGKGATSEWLEEEPTSLVALTWGLGTLLFLLGFLCGMAIAFLAGTS